MELNIEHRLTEVEGHTADHKRRIKDLEKRQDNLDKLALAVNGLAIKEENVEKTVNEIKTDVKTLTDKPAKRWDGIVDKILFTIIGAIIGYVLIKLGIGA